MGVEASVVIDFESTSEEGISGIILVELDDTHANNLDSDGNVKSSFAPEEVPVFLIHHDSTIEITGVECTDGKVAQVSTLPSLMSRTRSLEGVFTKADSEISLSYADASDLDETWYGNQATIYIDDQVIKVSEGGDFPCYCTADFSVLFQQQWKLTPPPLDLGEDDTYTIYVVVYVREIT